MKVFVPVILIMLLMASYGLGMNQYCQMTPRHTLCRSRAIGPACGTYEPTRGVSERDRDQVLEIHNTKRAMVALGLERRGATGPQPSASNMRMLEWDDELAMLAQRHADQCAFHHDCTDCRRTSRFSTGQNMFITFDTDSIDTVDWQKVINSWYDEVDIFDTRVIQSYRYQSATGHYSQMVWAETAYIGCGFIMFKDGGWYKKLYVCNYGPSGNIIRSPIYKIGPPCSHCSVGSSCSNSYPMLCDNGGEGRDNYSGPSFPNQKLSTFHLSDVWNILKFLRH